MNGVAEIVVTNACTALVVALLVSMTTRVVRRPSLVHAMWLIVLLELLVPPVYEIGVLPQPQRLVSTVSVSEMRTPLPIAVTEAHPPAPIEVAASSFDWRAASLGAAGISWLIGAAFVLAIAARRVWRFRRRLTDHPMDRRQLESSVRRLARSIGLRRTPTLRVVEGRVSPCIWLGSRGTELLFPAALVRRLTSVEIDALIAHELAHVARRDHWVRYVELLASAVFWWHPVMWWARSRLRRVEEQCCDQIVLRAIAAPGAYARGLLKTVEFLAGTGRPVPALASGVGEARHMEERLTMIMNQPPPARHSWVMRLTLAALALALLLVVPTWSERATAAEGRGEPSIETSGLRDDMLDLERQALQLEEQLRQIRGQQAELKHELHRQQIAAELSTLDEQADALERDGRTDEADELRDRLHRLEREAEISARAMELERLKLQERAAVEIPLRERQLEIEELRSSGDLERAERLEDEAIELQRRLEERLHDVAQREQLLEQERMHAQMDKLHAEVDRLRDAGMDDAADKLERQYALKRLAEQQDRLRENDAELAYLEAQLMKLQMMAAKLEREGRSDELEEVRQRMDELRLRLELELSETR